MNDKAYKNKQIREQEMLSQYKSNLFKSEINKGPPLILFNCK